MNTQMSSSVWSVSTERSSSSQSWDEGCDEESQRYLQTLLETIDRVVFFGDEVPEEFSSELSQECLIWKNKFANKDKNTNTKEIDKKCHKLKSLSAPKINTKCVSHTRSHSQTNSLENNLKLQSIPKYTKVMPNQREKHLQTIPKPLILPPIVNMNSKRNYSKSSNVPKIFPKSSSVQTIDKILNRSTDISLDVNVSKISILPHFNKYMKLNKQSFPPILNK